MPITLNPTVRNYRFLLGGFVIFALVVFLFTSHPSQVADSLEKAKSSIQQATSSSFDSQDYPPKPNGDPPVGNSPQYADDSSIPAKPAANSAKQPIANSPQFGDDSQVAEDENGQNPKAADKETPIKEAPKPNGSSNGGVNNAIKDKSKAYEGVPDKESDFENSDSSSSSSSPAKSLADCTKDPEYVIMVDAGSTGSRVHIYEFDVCYSPPKLNNEVFEMLKPGLSSFDTDAVGAAASLDPLLELALKSVPKAKQGCTPIAVKATAGLRKLGEEKSNIILKEVRKHLEQDYPFAVVDKKGIEIMSGDDEGVYAWITTNYLLGNIGSSEKLPTAAVFDLGGGSTQIVFEPEFKNGEKMIDGEHKYNIDFGGRSFELYQFSHLGYGLMAGRNKVNSLILETAIKDGKVDKATKEGIVLNSPCIPPGLTATDVEVELDSGSKYSVTLKGSEFASSAQCRFLAEAVLRKDVECTEEPCSFNGVHQPSLVRTFKERNDLFIFSFFYDRTNPLGMPSSFTLEELSDLAKLVCRGEESWTSTLSAIDGSIKELTDEPQWCLDLSFQVALLRTGYDIPLHRELRTAKKIAGNELGWCLGASLPLLDKKSGWKCRVQEVV